MSEFMTAKEVAEYLRLSKGHGAFTVRKWAMEGKIRAWKIGDFWRFKKEDVDHMIHPANVVAYRR